MLIKAVTDLKELNGIKTLQQQNLKSVLTADEAEAEGFVTAEYDVEYLHLMNERTPAIVAKDDERVVGYALATVKDVGLKHDLLHDLFKTIDGIIYDGRRLSDTRYIVVGQLCVAKGYRGLGLVHEMYTAFRDVYASAYQFCITDVAENNPRSLKAHLKSGFKVIDTLRYGGIGWHIVLWDWNDMTI